MPIAAAFAVPHPPLAISGVGRGQESAISSTLEAYREIGRRIARIEPEALVIVSPHATSYYDYFHIAPGKAGSGDFSAYGDPDDVVTAAYDQPLVRAITNEAIKASIPAGTIGAKDPALDHGTMVPLSFIQAAGVHVPIVRVSPSGMSALDHYRFGQCIARASERIDRSVVLIASGDLSHKLKHAGPYGFAPEARVFDREVYTALAAGDFGSLLRIDRDVVRASAQCGLPCFQIMAGALDGKLVNAELLSYECPFGIGYAVAAFRPLWDSPDRHFGDTLEHEERERRAALIDEEDAYVRLARLALEGAVRDRRRLPVPDRLPMELTARRGGVFVTLFRNGELRGSMGTLEATRGTLADEIIANAVGAGTHDTRFPAVTPGELGQITYCVDVLGEPELVLDRRDLDPTRYGIIVSTPDGRRGSVLPRTDGLQTPAQQIRAACRKGLIETHESITIQRFEVTRHRIQEG